MTDSPRTPPHVERLPDWFPEDVAELRFLTVAEGIVLLAAARRAWTPAEPEGRSEERLRNMLSVLEAADNADPTDRRHELTLALDRAVTQSSRRASIAWLRAALSLEEPT